MEILALEPYAALSHLLFLEGLARHSRHSVLLATLPARNWKWRMRTASLHFSQALTERSIPDILLASDYLNLAELSALLPDEWRGVPKVLYFHENQLTYPMKDGERRDVHFGLTHIHSMLAADEVWFNSSYHFEDFMAAAAELLARVPEIDPQRIEEQILGKSSIEPLGIDVPANAIRPRSDCPVVLWNHRLEYDKAPERLVTAARALVDSNEPFRLRILGQRFREVPPALAELREVCGERLEDLGFLPSRSAYEEVLRTSDISFSTARHEFFGVATAEAMRSGCLPVLPNGLAYPELLPQEFRADERFLYPPASSDDHPNGAATALVRAVRAVRCGNWLDDRTRIAEWVGRFDMPARARVFDRCFERVWKART